MEEPVRTKATAPPSPGRWRLPPRRTRGASARTASSGRSAKAAWATSPGRAGDARFAGKVALKVIKRGMDTRQVIARFEAERQALALMDHPDDRAVFDAGATADGRPYFVMEYVQRRADHRVLRPAPPRPRERLELFMQVCEGVQHAHQKGIIHRDLKPSNMLVTVQDDARRPEDHRLRRRQGDGAAAHRAHAVHRARPARSARRST